MQFVEKIKFLWKNRVGKGEQYLSGSVLQFQIWQGRHCRVYKKMSNVEAGERTTCVVI